jgi:hypothetical protein
MADIRLVNAFSNEFWLLEELEVDDLEAAASSVKREEVLCNAEIDMNCHPFQRDFSENQLPNAEVLRATYKDCISVRNEDKGRYKGKRPVPLRNRRRKPFGNGRPPFSPRPRKSPASMAASEIFPAPLRRGVSYRFNYWGGMSVRIREVDPKR